MTLDQKDQLIVRQSAYQAAARAVAGHPENEVAYDEDGKPVGARTVDIAERILTIASLLEEWAWRGLEPVIEARAQPQKAVSAPQTDEKDDPDRVPVAEHNFDIDVCPRHGKAQPSKYNTEMNPLYCPERDCEWGRTDFFNEDDETGETTRVTKYRMTKGKGTWMYRDAYLDNLRNMGLIE